MKLFIIKMFTSFTAAFIHSPIPTDLIVLERWITCVKNFTALQGSKCPLEDFRRSVETLFNLAICP